MQVFLMFCDPVRRHDCIIVNTTWDDMSYV